MTELDETTISCPTGCIGCRRKETEEFFSDDISDGIEEKVVVPALHASISSAAVITVRVLQLSSATLTKAREPEADSDFKGK